MVITVEDIKEWFVIEYATSLMKMDDFVNKDLQSVVWAVMEEVCVCDMVWLFGEGGEISQRPQILSSLLIVTIPWYLNTGTACAIAALIHSLSLPLACMQQRLGSCDELPKHPKDKKGH